MERAGGPVRRTTAYDQRRGRQVYNAIRRAMGARSDVSASDYGSYSDGNAKLAKSLVPVFIGGVTYAPAATVRHWHTAATHDERRAVAEAIGLTLEELATLCAATLCARSTAGCRAACNLRTSGRMAMEQQYAANNGLPWYAVPIVRAQLARTLLLLADPVGAVALASTCVDRVADIAADRGIGARWRLAVADDIRWEAVAPAILTHCRRRGVGMYAYTKWAASERPAVRGVSFARSASERTTVADIAAIIAARGNAVVVFDTRRGEPLPARWQGMRVIDGDLSDDRSADPRGVIIGLRAKGAAIGAATVGAFGTFVFPADDAAASERARHEPRRVHGPADDETPVTLAVAR